MFSLYSANFRSKALLTGAQFSAFQKQDNTDIQIPKPTDSRSDGKQVATTQTLETIDGIVNSPFSIVNEIEGVAARGRGFGNDITNVFVIGTMRQLEMQNRKLVSDIEEIREELDSKKEELSQSKQREAVLQVRIDSAASSKNLVNLAMVIGTLLFGAGINMTIALPTTLNIAITIAGVVLVLLSWLSGSEGKKK